MAKCAHGSYKYAHCTLHEIELHRTSIPHTIYSFYLYSFPNCHQHGRRFMAAPLFLLFESGRPLGRLLDCHLLNYWKYCDFHRIKMKLSLWPHVAQRIHTHYRVRTLLAPAKYTNRTEMLHAIMRNMYISIFSQREKEGERAKMR